MTPRPCKRAWFQIGGNVSINGSCAGGISQWDDAAGHWGLTRQGTGVLGAAIGWAVTTPGVATGWVLGWGGKGSAKGRGVDPTPPQRCFLEIDPHGVSKVARSSLVRISRTRAPKQTFHVLIFRLFGIFREFPGRKAWKCWVVSNFKIVICKHGCVRETREAETGTSL